MSEERVLFEDAKFKITDLRFIFKNDFIPIDQIEEVKVNLKVFNLTFAFVCFVLSFSSFVLIPKYGLLIVVIFFIWMSYPFLHYVELWITDKNGRSTKIATDSLTNATYLYKIEDTINHAIEENARRQKEDVNFDYTDTMKFRQRLKDLEGR